MVGVGRVVIAEDRVVHLFVFAFAAELFEDEAAGKQVDLAAEVGTVPAGHALEAFDVERAIAAGFPLLRVHPGAGLILPEAEMLDQDCASFVGKLLCRLLLALEEVLEHRDAKVRVGLGQRVRGSASRHLRQACR